MTNSTTFASASAYTVNTKGNNTMIINHNGSEIGVFDNTAPVFHGAAAVKFAQRFLDLVAECGSQKAAFGKMFGSSKQSSFVVSFDANNNKWQVVIPVEAILNFGKFDVKGNACLNSAAGGSNVVRQIRLLMKKLATSDFNAAREYVLASGIRANVSNFVRDILNSTTAKAQRGLDGFYAKAIADWRIPQMVGVGKGMLPVIYVAEDSFIFDTGITENEIVILNRTPVPFSIACVIKVAPFRMDTNVVAVNPLIMDVTRGDNDGDAVNIVAPRLAGAPVAVGSAMEFNNSVVSLGGYRRGLAAKGKLSTTLAEVAKVATYSAKTSDKFNKKYFTYNNEVDATVWASTLVKVNEVYSQHVAAAYEIAFNALQQFTLRTAEGDTEFDRDSMLADVVRAFERYEDEALCGYSEETYDGMVAYLNETSVESEFINNARNNLTGQESLVSNWNSLTRAKYSVEDAIAFFSGNDYQTRAFVIRQAAKKYKSAQSRLVFVRASILAAQA